MGWLGLRFAAGVALVLGLSLACCHGDTDQRDVFAINSLYVALGTPSLPGWQAQDGDPCGAGWQGVGCVFSNITELKLPGANLGGELGDNLGFFSSIISIDLSGNHIGGLIPENLPATIRNFFLSGNQFTGPIPNGLASLSQLTDLSLDGNHLSGQIPDAFEPLGLLVNLNLGDNNLSGPLPPSMGKLPSLVTFNMQNNQITGTLDVLQDLPSLANLNVENNLLSGPVPPRLLTLPNFRNAGNPFNTTIIPSPPAPPTISPSPAPTSPDPSPGGDVPVPSRRSPGKPKQDTNAPPSKTTFFTAKRVIWIALAGLGIFVVIAVVMCVFMSKSCKKLQPVERLGKPPHSSPPNNAGGGIKYKESLLQQKNQSEQAPKTLLVGKEMHQRMDQKNEMDLEKGLPAAPVRTENHAVPRTGIDMKHPKQSLVPAPPDLQSRVVMSSKKDFILSVTCFTVAELQQYTRSFSQGNLIGRGTIGSVYRAKLPEGKVLAVKKLSNAATTKIDDEFLDLVSGISKLKHPNVVELVGYCAEYSQYLLAFEYYRNGTLYDALNLDDEIHSKLSWNLRIMIALGAAKALEYLHETCQPPIIHRNFKSANLLLDDKLIVSVSDCGLSSVMSQETQNQLSVNLSANGYGAPELETGSYTLQSDIYSFGVVMLELLTARKPYDRSRPRGEQFLVSWAISQLHDIDSLSRMVDPSLKGAYPSKSLSRFADIISLCLQPEPEFRPPMSEIVQNIMLLVQK
uniref:Protein kinase domain-containing protein n=1 Tax=Kalanchoe fedtschenkoi TaxID=63787 RepID=A0A7N0V1F8_KALFE